MTILPVYAALLALLATVGLAFWALGVYRFQRQFR